MLKRPAVLMVAVLAIVACDDDRGAGESSSAPLAQVKDSARQACGRTVDSLLLDTECTSFARR